MISTRRSALLLLTLATLTGGCSTARLASNWIDPAYTAGKFKKVLILGLAPQEGTRNMLEGRMVEEFKKQGVEAVASTTVMPGDRQPTKDDVKAVVEGQGFDGVLISRLIGSRDEVSYTPPTYAVPYPYYNGLYSYYGTVGPMVYSPGYIDQYRVYTIETNVYTVRDAKLVWSVVSETFDPTNINKAVDDFVYLIADELHKDGLL